MAIRRKIDSNETNAFYAEEESIGTLPAVPVWKPLEPNSYDDFGGEATLLARNPINSSRQRKKGVITDFEAAGGINQDFTQTNFQDLLQGVMFADFREKPAAAVTGITATGYTVADESAFSAGMLVFASSFGATANNGLKVVTGTAAGEVQVAGLTVAVGDAGRLQVVGVQADAGDLDVVAPVGDYPYLTSTALDFTDLGLTPGEWVFLGGDGAGQAFATANNNGFKRIRSVTADRLTFDRSVSAMVDEVSDAEAVRIYTGRVLKNETGAFVKRRSYQIERQLGAPDSAELAKVQAEYLTGAIPNEFSLAIETADKINADISFVAIDNEQRGAALGIKAGTRLNLVESDAFNTSSDFSTMRLSIHTPGVATATPLFGFLTELSLNVNNNISLNKAVAVLGGFDVTAGTFEVSAEATAYFATVEAVQAVRNNEDVSLHGAIVKDNAGWLFDLPLIALGDGRLNVEQDEPIMLPLAMDAATAIKLNPNTDYTLMWVFFDYLPTLAE
jgi:hypothetical protein